MPPIEAVDLTAEQKEKILEIFLIEQKRIIFAPDVLDNNAKKKLSAALITLLVNDEHLCGKVLNNRVCFELHSVNIAPTCRADGDEIILSLHQGSPEKINTAINAAIAKREEAATEHDASMPLSAAQNDVTGHDLIIGSGVDEDGNSSINTKNGYREPYDPRAEILSEGRAHTYGDLIRNGRARTAGKEDGAHWLWQLDYKYVLSDEALKSKTPGRWFRDLCVVCGVSTPMLEHLTGILQVNWSYTQKDTSASKKMINKALDLVLPTSIVAGREINNGGWLLPAGSLFELPTIEVEDNKRQKKVIVAPKELNRISQALYKEPYVSINAEYTLKRLKHLSDAYTQGKISAEELKRLNIPAAPLHDMILHYDKIGQEILDSQFFGAYGNNIGPVINKLHDINKKHLHINEALFTTYVNALTRFPRGRVLTIVSLPPDDAFSFAQKHHNGNLGNFLSVYRKANGNNSDSVAHSLGVPRTRIQQFECDVNQSGAAQNRALKPLNAWNLPTDSDGKIKQSVAEYINDFLINPIKLTPPESHWLTAREALEQFAGMHFEVNDDISNRHNAANQLLHNLQNIIAKELEKYPADPYTLITLPDGHEVLVKNTPGEPPRLFDDEIRHWIIAYANLSKSAWGERINKRRSALAQNHERS